MATTSEDPIVRIGRTADEIAAAIAGVAGSQVSRRPDATNWSATEIVCHLRDVEEMFLERIRLMLAAEDPKFAAVDPDRWAALRQYHRSDVRDALAAFRSLREETLSVLRGLTPAQAERGGTHLTRGPMKVRDFGPWMASHDDNHLDQLRRALKGQP